MNNKYKRNGCSTRWYKFKAHNYTIGALRYLAKEGVVEKHNNSRQVAHALTGIFGDGHDYRGIDIDTPLLTTKTEATDGMNAGQKVFKHAVQRFLKGSTKSLIWKSRYGSGKTTFVQRLNKYKPERVLKQTLARNIMRHCWKLEFKNYLGSYDEPDEWEAPRVIIQLHSLLNLMYTTQRWNGR